MATSVGVRELRDNLSRVLKRVEEGEVVRVLRHGKDVLELRPLKRRTGNEHVESLKGKGILSGGSGKIGPVRSVKNKMPGKPVSGFIVDERR